jgi:hypothetical protein
MVKGNYQSQIEKLPPSGCSSGWLNPHPKPMSWAATGMALLGQSQNKKEKQNN